MELSIELIRIGKFALFHQVIGLHGFCVIWSHGLRQKIVPYWDN